MSCDKYKNKFYVGIGIILLMVLMKPISQYIINLVELMGIEIFIIISIVLSITGLYLGLPYVTCLSNNNKRGKPPF